MTEATERNKNILEAHPQRIAEALSRRSFVNWKYYALLFELRRFKEEDPSFAEGPFYGLFADQELPSKLKGIGISDELKGRITDFGNVSLIDLMARAPVRQFIRKFWNNIKKTRQRWDSYLAKLSRNWQSYENDLKSEHEFLPALTTAVFGGVSFIGKSLLDSGIALIHCIIVPFFKLVSQTLMLAIRTLFYGPLDWLAITATDLLDKFFIGKKPLTEDVLKKRGFFIVFLNLLTAPIRLIGGLVEGIQEPLHLKKFWAKDVTFAWQQFKRGEISPFIFGVKVFLWLIKVTFTILALFTLAGGVTAKAAAGPSHYAHKIASPAHTAFNWFNAKLHGVYEKPFIWFEKFLVQIEKFILKAEGVDKPINDYSAFSNAETAVEIAVEASVSKFADALPETVEVADATEKIKAEKTSPALLTPLYNALCIPVNPVHHPTTTTKHSPQAP